MTSKTRTNLRTTVLTTVAAAALSGLVLTGGGAGAQNQFPTMRGNGYTTLDHPALPCHLSVEAVANWGETSAHLPLACTYGPK
jgi:hypothetical protein